MNERWSELLNPVTFRKRAEPKNFDGRNPFENDLGRLISSSPIRRLQDKTQVFPLESSDYIRTRLTHSLEVSYMGSSIGQSIEKYLFDNKKVSRDDFGGHISSLLRVAGLVHDIGNPPFGHFGEESIKKFFKKYFATENHCDDFTDQEKADFTNFDGNAQAFRILKRLHFLGDHYSFNLTYPALASVIKYPSDSLTGNLGSNSDEIAKKKFGYFASEQSDYEIINEALKLNHRRHPAVYLMEAADDISYSAADIEDGVKIGILDFEQIRTVFEEHLKVNTDVLEKLDKIYAECKNYKSDRLAITVQKFRIHTQSIMIGSVIQAFKDNYDQIMKGELEKELLDVSSSEDIRRSFKELQKQVFSNKKIVTKELAGDKIMTGLLEIFVKASESDKFKSDGNNLESRLYNMISSSYRHLYENFSEEWYQNNKYNRLRLIVDDLSGMTDSYALAVYQKLNGIKL
jgi:dGTPase